MQKYGAYAMKARRASESVDSGAAAIRIRFSTIPTNQINKKARLLVSLMMVIQLDVNEKKPSTDVSMNSLALAILWCGDNARSLKVHPMYPAAQQVRSIPSPSAQHATVALMASLSSCANTHYL